MKTFVLFDLQRFFFVKSCQGNKKVLKAEEKYIRMLFNDSKSNWKEIGQ